MNETAQQSTLRVAAWHDPAIERNGIPPHSRTFTRVWSPLLGPAATMLYQCLVELVVERPRSDVPVETVGAALGLSPRKTLQVVPRALDRLSRHALVVSIHPDVAVRLIAPQPTVKQLRRYPEPWRAELGLHFPGVRTGTAASRHPAGAVSPAVQSRP